LYREVTIKTGDGINVKGWIFPAQDTSGILNEYIGKIVVVPDSLKPKPREYAYAGGQKPTIVICDGDAGNMAFTIFYAYHYFTRGYTVFTFDWRGFGESDAWKIREDDLCCSEFLIDYASAINLIKTQPEVDPHKICLMGFSTGAYLSFAMMANREDIAAYIGRAIITSFDDLIKNLHKVDPSRKFFVPAHYPQQLLPVNAAKNVKTPVLLIVGENDIRTPVWMSKKVYEKLKNKKELWIVPNAEHGGIKGPEMINYPEFFNKTLLFLNDNLK